MLLVGFAWILLAFAGCAVSQVISDNATIGQDTSQISSGQYSILASQFIRPNSDYFVSVNLHDSNESVTIRVSIQSETIESEYFLSKNVTLAPFTSRTLHFETGPMTPLESTYILVAEGLSGLIFRNESTLWLNEKAVSIHVQTDRPEYAMGDKLRFRVLLLDVDAKPVTVDHKLNVFLKVFTGS